MPLIDITGYLATASADLAANIDRLQLAEDAEIKQLALVIGQQTTVALSQISNLIKAEIDGLASIEDRGVADLRALLDGATLTLRLTSKET